MNTLRIEYITFERECPSSNITELSDITRLSVPKIRYPYPNSISPMEYAQQVNGTNMGFMKGEKLLVTPDSIRKGRDEIIAKSPAIDGIVENYPSKLSLFVRRSIENNGSVEIAYDSYDYRENREKVKVYSEKDYVKGLIIAAAYTGLPIEEFEELMKSGEIGHYLSTDRRLKRRKSDRGVHQDKHLFLLGELNKHWEEISQFS